MFFPHLAEGYNSHADEVDPERIELMANQAVEDAQWVVDKVCVLFPSSLLSCFFRRLTAILSTFSVRVPVNLLSKRNILKVS
jgi:hypothetical protein